MRKLKRPSRVPRTNTRLDIGTHLREGFAVALTQGRRDGTWQRVLAWKPHQVAADRMVADGGSREAVLRREPTNATDPNAVQVWVGGYSIGYVEAWEAAHLQTAFEVSSEPLRAPLRRSKRKLSPLFDVFLPECHPTEEAQCAVCKVLADASREYSFGTLDPRAD